MQTPETIAECFSHLDFHDDTLVNVRVLPSQERGNDAISIVEVRLNHYSEDQIRVIRFSGCSNLRVAMDFDVLADNLPQNTSRHDADTKASRISHLMESQKGDWDVNYKGSGRSPLTTKLAALNELVFFRVQFFGGVIDVIARNYLVETVG